MARTKQTARRSINPALRPIIIYLTDAQFNRLRNLTRTILNYATIKDIRKIMKRYRLNAKGKTRKSDLIEVVVDMFGFPEIYAIAGTNLSDEEQLRRYILKEVFEDNVPPKVLRTLVIYSL